jgi:hypothetical protein
MSNKFNALYGDDSDSNDDSDNEIITNKEPITNKELITNKEPITEKEFTNEQIISDKETKNNNDTKIIVKEKCSDIETNDNTKNINKNNINDFSFTTVYKKNNSKKNNSKNNGTKNLNIYNVRETSKQNKYSELFEILPFKTNMVNNSIREYYKIFAYHSNDKNWNYQNNHNISTIRYWNDIPKYFNSITEDNLINYNLFIMKNEISPMWEDNENRFASRCQIKLDTIENGKKMLNKLLIYIANNNLLKNSTESLECVNGLIFTPKKMINYNSMSKQTYYSIIEIWFKNNHENNISQLHKIFNKDIANELLKYSIRIKPIKPEY